MNRIEAPILQNLQTFIAFARNRLGDPELAEDVVQESILKALSAAKMPSEDEETVAWFYRILRRSIIDLYRRQEVRQRALSRFEKELSEEPTAADQRVLCECFKRLLPSVPEQYRALLEQIDLEGKDAGETARELGLTKNNLTVRLFRARKLLREKLAQTCRACSKHGCLDCTCGDSHHP